MYHRTRVFRVSEVPTAENLARMLTEQSWALCSAFCVAGHPDYLFLNDSDPADGAIEYGVVKKGIDGQSDRQLETVSFSPCSFDQALSYIREVLAGEWDKHIFAYRVAIRVETPERHGRCPLCT
jgi:hypothetical protein